MFGTKFFGYKFVTNITISLWLKIHKSELIGFRKCSSFYPIKSGDAGVSPRPTQDKSADYLNYSTVVALY